MRKEEVIENLKQIEKDLDISLNRCMSQFNPMICGTEYQQQKMQEMLPKHLLTHKRPLKIGSALRCNYLNVQRLTSMKKHFQLKQQNLAK